MWNFIAARDRNLMRKVHRWSAPRWVRLWMVSATRGGDGWLWYVLAVLVLLFGGATRLPAVASGGLSAGAGVLVFLWLKRLTARKRPCAFEPHCWARLLPPDQFSFPSGHSLVAFAVAVSIGLFYPALLAALLFCAASVAASRVVLGMHYLSDVIAGALLGSTLGLLSAAIFQ